MAAYGGAYPPRPDMMPFRLHQGDPQALRTWMTQQLESHVRVFYIRSFITFSSRGAVWFTYWSLGKCKHKAQVSLIKTPFSLSDGDVEGGWINERFCSFLIKLQMLVNKNLILTSRNDCKGFVKTCLCRSIILTFSNELKTLKSYLN